MFNTHAAKVQHQLALASNTPVRPQHTEPTVNTSIAQPHSHTYVNPLPAGGMTKPCEYYNINVCKYIKICSLNVRSVNNKSILLKMT